MQIFIIGTGAVGAFLAKNLCDEHDVVCVEKDKAVCDSVQSTYDVLVHQGEGDNPSVLKEAGIGEADVLLAVSGDDRVNILSALFAHAHGVERIIARISDPSYMEFPDLLDLREISVVNPVTIFVEKITNLINAPFAIKTETFAGGSIQMLKLRVDDDSPIAGKKLSELGPPTAWIFAALSRGGEITIPSGETVLQGGDYIFALGVPTQLDRLKSLLGVGEEGVKSVVVAGAGMLGRMVARNLARFGISVKLLEKDADRARAAAEELEGVDVYCGDTTSGDTLKEIGVGSADYFIALTGEDESNVLSALLAKNLGAARTVVLYKKADYIDVIESIGVDRAMSLRLATASEILSYLHLGGVAHVALVEEGKAEILEFVITKRSRILGVPLRECRFPKGAIVGIVISGKEIVIPNGDYSPMVGDRLVVFALPEAVRKVEKLLG